MNILTEALPDAVEVAGVVYEIDTDFRAALRTILAFEDDTLTGAEKRLVLLQNLYREPPADFAAAFAVGVKFLNGGKDADEGESEEPQARLYSFAKDAPYIFAAFQQTHGIDLDTASLHWWKFLALFMDLGSETTFCNLVGLRKRVKTGKASKEEMKAYRELGDIAVIEEPDTRTPEEREAEAAFMALLKG